MHRFAVPAACIRENEALLPEAEAVHALRVLRLRVGDEVQVLDGRGGLWGGYLIQAEPGSVRIRLAAPLPNAESPLRLTLYQGLPKFEKMDFIVQKATELGVCRVVPVILSRSVSRPDEKDAEKKLVRWRRIAQEAAKQSGRSELPEILAPLRLQAALSDMRERELLIVPWEDAGGTRLLDLQKKRPQAADIGVLIGPEGGMSAEEVRLSGGEQVRLGPRILRAETAAVVSVALIMQLWGDI